MCGRIIYKRFSDYINLLAYKMVQHLSVHLFTPYLNRDGASKSGLVSVIWCVLDRLKATREVAIADTVRLVRSRRQQAITGLVNMTQTFHCKHVTITWWKHPYILVNMINWRTITIPRSENDWWYTMSMFFSYIT